MKNTKMLFEEVFDEVELNNVEEIDGGKWSSFQCKALWLSCLEGLGGIDCGGTNMSACTLYADHCYD